MARTIAEVQAELDALRAARAKGVLEVEFGDQRTRFGDAEDLARRESALEAELAGLKGTKVTRRLARFSKGTR